MKKRLIFKRGCVVTRKETIRTYALFIETKITDFDNGKRWMEWEGI